MIDVGIGRGDRACGQCPGVPAAAASPSRACDQAMGNDIARALEDLSTVAADPDSGMQSWPRHDRQLTVAAEQARAAARHARESLRWNPRAKAERAVPRPDGAVIDSLEEPTARTRAVARFLPDIRAADRPGRDRASFGKDYAALLRNLASPIRQLADLRTSPPRAALTAASDCQHQLEREQRTCRSRQCAQRRATPRPAHQRNHQRGRRTPSRPQRPGGPPRQAPRTGSGS